MDQKSDFEYSITTFKETIKNIFIHQDEKDWQIEDEWNQQDQFDKEIMIQSMLDTLQYMPVGFRTVINLYIMEGYTHEQIASQLGISVGTSKSQLNRAKEHLRKSLLKTLKVNA
ncbi:MAG: sigma-70 family RNA polymerase sigma factor [Saprospiraceae bacterium]|nr:sigma-70 family RNA polymerase sigma factor [Saprospiraceae bacterium]